MSSSKSRVWAGGGMTSLMFTVSNKLLATSGEISKETFCWFVWVSKFITIRGLVLSKWQSCNCYAKHPKSIYKYLTKWNQLFWSLLFEALYHCDSSSGRGYCVEFLGKTLYSVHPGIKWVSVTLIPGASLGWTRGVEILLVASCYIQKWE